MKIKDKTYKIFDRSWDVKNPWAELPFDRILERCAERDGGKLEQLEYKINFIFKIFAANPDLIPDEIKEEMIETLEHSCQNGYQDDYKVVEIVPGGFSTLEFATFIFKKLNIKIEKPGQNNKLCDFCDKVLMDGPALKDWETPEEYFTRLFEENKVKLKSFRVIKKK